MVADISSFLDDRGCETVTSSPSTTIPNTLPTSTKTSSSINSRRTGTNSNSAVGPTFPTVLSTSALGPSGEPITALFTTPGIVSSSKGGLSGEPITALFTTTGTVSSGRVGQTGTTLISSRRPSRSFTAASSFRPPSRPSDTWWNNLPGDPIGGYAGDPDWENDVGYDLPSWLKGDRHDMEKTPTCLANCKRLRRGGHRDYKTGYTSYSECVRRCGTKARPLKGFPSESVKPTRKETKPSYRDMIFPIPSTKASLEVTSKSFPNLVESATIFPPVNDDLQTRTIPVYSDLPTPGTEPKSCSDGAECTNSGEYQTGQQSSSGSSADICPQQCNPFNPADNHCHSSTSCVTTTGTSTSKYYCTCPAGFRAANSVPEDFTKNFRTTNEQTRAYVRVPPGVECTTPCADQLCTEVVVRDQCL